MQPQHLFHCVVPGEAAGKKNTQRVTYPRLYGLALRHNGDRVNSPKQLMAMLAHLARTNPQHAAAIAESAVEAMAPVLQPSSDYTRWAKKARSAMHNAAVGRELPILPEGHLGACRVIVFLAAGQTGDLINFEQAVWDVLQDASIIPTDYWLNSHGEDSRRRWDEPLQPRVEVDLYDLGPRPAAIPEIRVEGLTAAKERLGPLTFMVGSPDGKMLERCTAPRGTSRERIAMEAARLWRDRFGSPLPPGSTVRIVPA